MNKVEVRNRSIYIDDKATQIISGAIHYFRVLPELWNDRILKARQMGLNCIETYMCHNLHEPVPGKFDFSGILDVERFLETIRQAGMYAIMRPGPYICAEWENGGLPPWIASIPDMDIRCSNPAFMAVVDRYLDEILPILKKYLYTAGGPIIMMQIENEYGSFGKDKVYLQHIRERYLAHGIDVPIFTSDGPNDALLLGGTLPECIQTVNFGSNPDFAFAISRRHRPDDPDFCMEFWNGWFDHWGEKHHTRSAQDAAATLDAMLGCGASVNIYMFHGGSNFGFMAGANGNGDKTGIYNPTVTSYDYDSPLSECGDPTEKYFAMQNVIRKYRPDAPFGTPQPVKKQLPQPVKFTQSASLWSQLDRLAEKKHALKPLSMEKCGQKYGFINYRTIIDGPFSLPLFFPEVHDRVSAYLDGEYVGTVFRTDEERNLPLTVTGKSAVLDLLVENTGRINYGPRTGTDCKGLPLGVCIGYQQQINFDIWNLELDDISRITYGDFQNLPQTPAFHRGWFEAEAGVDTFIRTPGVKGVIWINGFNIGRYWEIGPQKTLYIPGPLLKQGKNEIVVMELHTLSNNCADFTDHPEL